ncbi:WxL domain-containing protein [Enterococcus hirae]|nr:WxL domain-containing protein [Enterococcus hirae]EMF0406537.1 WxL domain-containing protein [Enterococcus hirae]
MKKQALVAAFSLVAPMVLGSTGVFADDLSKANTSVSATFTVPSTNTDNPQPNNPSGSNPGSTDENTNLPLAPNGNFALAYVPNNVTFGNIQLGTSGSLTTDLQLPKDATLNVGVKDTQHNQEGWTLTASFSGDLATNGVTIKTTTNEAKLNDNGTLKPLSDSSMIQVTPNFEINNSANTIMTGVAGKTFSGTYDLDLGDVSLNIPDVSQISAGQKSGTVMWNLTQTPTNP